MISTTNHERIVAMAAKVVGYWEFAASFTDRPNEDASARAGTAMEMWQLLTGLDDSDEALRFARAELEKAQVYVPGNEISDRREPR